VQSGVGPLRGEDLRCAIKLLLLLLLLLLICAERLTVPVLSCNSYK